MCVCVSPLQRVKDLSAEVREFVAIQDAKVIPLSAHTGHGLDSLRTTLAATLSQPGIGTPGVLGLEAPDVVQGVLVRSGAQVRAVAAGAGRDGEEGDVEVVVAEAPEGAATATVLDYTSSAKTGKMLVSFLHSCPALIPLPARETWFSYCVVASDPTLDADLQQELSRCTPSLVNGRLSAVRNAGLGGLPLFAN